MDKAIFKVFPEGDVIALFPEHKEGPYINSYQHVGQHGCACPTLLTDLPDATKEELGPLKKELQSIGYKI